MCLTDVALTFHILWTRLMTFSHGIVAGIACCHTLAIAAALASTQYSLPQFVQFYHFLSLKIYWAVYVFNTLCIVSCFDRLDIGLWTKAHLREMSRNHGNLLVTLGYLLSMGLSLAAHRHTAAIEAYSQKPLLWNDAGLHEWHLLVTIRDLILLLTWIFISFSSPNDLLHDRLIVIGKQQDESSRWRFLPKL